MIGHDQPLVNRLTHICLMDLPILINWTSIFHSRGVWCNFSFLFYFELIFLLADSEDPDQTPRSAASDLGLHCLTMSQKWDAMIIWVKDEKWKFFEINPDQRSGHGSKVKFKGQKVIKGLSIMIAQSLSRLVPLKDQRTHSQLNLIG